ncbi:MAG: ATP-dependent DNA helicase [Xanthomonadales bacterium]|nr:ATP-dependent DNA helicase [Gammaproteobacteria bacterium]MBT8053071.1 ATP-dependent DNA helicase [Gammaproteobacteria bacterium]NND56685.1 ATP-dependent DNA helicase [Xanthomonadales bacterium]NNK52670.1 ATP-dependent DNA helicase [Xanthomonadales bacterium]
MAGAVEAALAQGSALVVEAGTGIGKTLAYLVPALLSGERVIISTGTKTLQDQLFFRDIPLVQKALGLSVKCALLKGRGNYLCLHRMQIARTEGRLPTREAVAELEAVFDWSAQTVDGDLSIAGVITEDSGLLPLVTSTADNCMGGECPRFEECYVGRARNEAQEADVVVVNHHLLFADMAIKQSGFGEVLPGASAFIIDEAHQAPETATRFFSVSLSSRQVTELCRDFLAESSGVSGAMGILREPVSDCLQTVKEIQLVFSQRMPERGPWADLVRDEQARSALQALDQAINGLEAGVARLAGSARGMDGCIDRLKDIQGRLDRFDAEKTGDEVRWFEIRGRGFALNITPLEVSGVFNDFRKSVEAAWIFTSATLSVRGDFSHFTGSMGLDDALTLQLESPFDYENNALLWIPDDLPEPRDAGFVPALLRQVVPLLEASRGRAFLLFTSHRALRRAAEILAEKVNFPLFVQGQQPRSLLLEKFRESGQGVLLGSSSFWEGVDVIGDALSLVVIDKLPFAAPDDPVMEARSESLRRAGGNPFMQLYLPQAVISLKQGAGRLIRDVNDRGALVVCDPRIKTKSYGRVFLESLPPMKVAADRAELERFFDDQTAGC